MYKMNSVLSFVRGACQHLLQPMNLTCRTSGGNILRPLYSSPVRLQEAEIQTQPDASTNPTKSSKEFSFYPPFPGQDSGLRWGGKSFEELPIVHIKATYNNTHIQVTDSVGQSLTRTSCGTEGFRNVKKSTPIAAQTTGISAAAKVQAKGVTFVRVMVKGLGPGRSFCVFSLVLRFPPTAQKHALGFTGDTEVDSVNVFQVYMHTSAIKGLTMGGLEIVSITDGTPVPHNGCRPRKARRI